MRVTETQQGVGAAHGEWLTVDERRKALVARLDRMSPEERLRASRHEFDREQRAIWAGRYPDEVPTVNGEVEWIGLRLADNLD